MCKYLASLSAVPSPRAGLQGPARSPQTAGQTGPEVWSHPGLDLPGGWTGQGNMGQTEITDFHIFLAGSVHISVY